MPCECKGPGFCNRHQRPKSFPEWQLCQKNAAHRKALDEQIAKATAPAKSLGGVGTEVKTILAAMGFRPGANCKCHEHQRAWDERGVTWCKKNKQTLIKAIQEEASARGWLNAAMAKFGGAALIASKAISQAEAKGFE